MNLQGLWAIAEREYLTRVRTRAFLIGTVIFPLFIFGPLLLAGLGVGGRPAGPTQRTLAVADGIGGMTDALTRAIDARLPDGRPAHVIVAVENDPAEISHARQLVEAGAYDALLVIPSDALRGTPAQLVAGGRPGALPGQVREVLRQEYLQRRLTGAGMTNERVAALTAPPAMSVEAVAQQNGGSNEGARLIGPLMMIVLMYVNLLMYGMTVMRSVVQDKSTRVVEILVSVATPFEVMMGKIVGVGAVGLTQIGIWVLSAVGGAYVVPGVDERMVTAVLESLPLVQFALLYSAGLVLFLALYAGIGAACATEDDAAQLARPLSLLVALPAVFMSAAMGNADGLHIVALSYVPPLTPMLMLVRIVAGSAGWIETGIGVTLVAASAVAAGWASGRVFHVGLLSMGKRPSLRELWRWIREG